MFDKLEDILSNCQNDKYSKDDLNYWRAQVCDRSTLPELPTDLSNDSTDVEVSKCGCQISEFEYEHLKTFCESVQSDVYGVMLAVFKIFLYRYTHQNGLLIGSYRLQSLSSHPDHDRPSNVEGAAWIVRTEFSNNCNFLDVLSQVNKAGLDSQSCLPVHLFKKLFGEKECLDQKPALKVNFTFCNTVKSPSDDPQSHKHISQAPGVFQLSVHEGHSSIGLEWIYDRKLFRTETIQRMSEHFLNLLHAAIQDPREGVSRLPIMTNEERWQILVGWNNTATPAQNHCLHELFEAQVNRTPNALAVELFEKNRFSNQINYQQLNSRANQLAHYLIQLGVGPNILVGVCLYRSIDLVVAVLAILKAGGAYLPLDPAYPNERLAFMMTDSGISTLLTSRNLVHKVSGHPVKVVCTDENANKFIQFSHSNPVRRCRSEDLAYVIYTSGSTGTPKGTLIAHRGVVNYLLWCIKTYRVAEGSGAPVSSSISFDATVTSFFAPLLSGRKIVLLPEKEEIEALSNLFLSDENFSLIKITPPHLEILKHYIKPADAKNAAHAFVIGGEALTAGKLEFWRNHAPNTRLINEYGPTETVVGCSIYEVSQGDKLTNEVPIGKPIANTQMYILDRHMEPVPIGVLGEVYIGGAGLARGYLNRPELTAERFVPNPFSGDSTARLYKTGDLARYRPDGNIVYHGRIDHQVKIRGYRIELAEIDAALSTHPDIVDALTVVREIGGIKSLIAYILTGNPRPAVGDLRLHAASKLPEYMVPSLFVFLDHFPLTVNGKIDRENLPDPLEAVDELHILKGRPQTEREVQLVEIFQQCMHLRAVRINDDFFEIGGNSIQAAIIFAHIRKKFQKELPLSTLIGHPTIEKLALVIDSEPVAGSHSSLVPIQSLGTRRPLFCVHGGWGNVLFYRFLSKYLGNDQPLYGLQAKGLIDNEEPYFRLEEMAAHYIKEIKTVQPVGPYQIAGYCFGAIVAFEMARQLEVQGERVEFLGNFNGVSPTYNNEQLLMMSEIFRQLSVKQKLKQSFRLLKQQLRIKWTFAQFHMVMAVRSAVYQLYSMRRRKLPQALRRFYIIDAMMACLLNYQPAKYSGDLYIFRSPKIYRNPHLGWTDLVSGKIKTIDIPGNHSDRRKIMYEPFVEFLAKELKNILHQ